MKTAKEFFREKLKAKRPDRDITLAFTSIRAEEGMIWANEFASEQNAQLRKEWEAYHKKTLEEQWELAEETITKLRERIKFLEPLSEGNFEQANELNDQDQTIAQLRKEIEALQRERDSWPAERDQVVEDADKTITALRKENEELRKSMNPNPFLYPINSAKLKELVWKLDREVWAKVEAKEATTSWGREQTSILISQYFGQSSNEITRLTELLRKTMDLDMTMDLHAEIENAIGDENKR